MGLAGLMVEHRGPLAADFQRYYGLSLATIRSAGLPLREVAAYAANLPPDSAVARSVSPDDWWITPDIALLREVEHGLRVLAWQQTDDAGKRTPQNYPEPRPLTAAEIEAAKPERDKYDAMPLDEMADFLGWPHAA